jgi:hypothetical protein
MGREIRPSNKKCSSESSNALCVLRSGTVHRMKSLVPRTFKGLGETLEHPLVKPRAETLPQPN